MYRKIINSNPKRFQTGSVIKRRTFCKLFRVKNIVHTGTFPDVQRSNLALVGVQAEVNDILRRSGLVLRSRNYYSEFYICGLEQTGRVVLNQQEKAEANQACSDILEHAVIQRLSAKTWGTVQTTVAPLTASSGPALSAVYQQKQKRVKRWK